MWSGARRSPPRDGRGPVPTCRHQLGWPLDSSSDGIDATLNLESIGRCRWPEVPRTLLPWLEGGNERPGGPGLLRSINRSDAGSRLLTAAWLTRPPVGCVLAFAAGLAAGCEQAVGGLGGGRCLVRQSGALAQCPVVARWGSPLASASKSPGGSSSVTLVAKPLVLARSERLIKRAGDCRFSVPRCLLDCRGRARKPPDEGLVWGIQSPGVFDHRQSERGILMETTGKCPALPLIKPPGSTLPLRRPQAHAREAS